MTDAIKHTDGRWTIRQLGSSIRVYAQDANNAEICTIAKSGFVKAANDRKLADARLIAAAPDLLAAAIAFDADLSEYCDGPHRDALRAAIAKATGASVASPLEPALESHPPREPPPDTDRKKGAR